MNAVAPSAAEIVAFRDLARELAEWASEQTRTRHVTAVATKAGPADLVTDLDRSIERHVRDRVLARFPDHAFVGEEYGGSPAAGRPTWYLDPVDGTTNLANGVPWTAFSLAVAIDDQPLAGVVADPWRDSVYDAIAGAGARRNGEALVIAPGGALSGGVVGSELAGHEAWPGMHDFSLALTAAFCTLRIMGSGTLTLLGPAIGRGAGAVVHRFSPIDHLAATLIAQEAGAIVRGEDGRVTAFPSRGGVLVALPAVDAELFDLWATIRRRQTAQA